MSDLNYTLTKFILQSLGGVVSARTGREEARTEDNRGGVLRAGDSGAEYVPCLMSHKSPQGENLPLGMTPPYFEFRRGASYIKVSRGRGGVQVGGGRRGVVKGFSGDARRRLLFTIASVEREAELPCFVTLTYPEKFPSPLESKTHLKNFQKRFLRAFPWGGYIWKLEPQERGAPHFHLLVWGVPEFALVSFVPQAWFEIAGDLDPKHLTFHEGGFNNQHCVQRVRTWRGVWSYASKYLGKTFDVSGWSDIWTGRFWAVVNREKIPFGELVVTDIDISLVNDVRRYKRRFTKTKYKKNKGGKNISSRGVSFFCDADQWAERLQVIKK